MTSPIALRLRDAAAALRGSYVSLRSRRLTGLRRTAACCYCLGRALPASGAGRGHCARPGHDRPCDRDVAGRCHGCLPGRVAEVEMSRRWVQRVLRLLASTYAMAGPLAGGRFDHLAAVGRRS